MRTLLRWSGVVALLALVFTACAVPVADAARADTTAPLALAAPTDATPVASVDLLQTTRPADSLLFDEMQVSLKSLAWRATDGKFRVTNRDNGAGPWESNVRDAVWKGLFYTTQGAGPTPSTTPQ